MCNYLQQEIYTLISLLRTSGHDNTQEEWYVVIKAYKFTIFEILNQTIFECLTPASSYSWNYCAEQIQIVAELSGVPL